MANCSDCKDGRLTCGVVVPSSCVPFTGDLPDFFVEPAGCSTLNVNDVFEQYGDKLDLLLIQNDVTGLNKRCLGYDAANVTIKKLHQAEIDAICSLDSRVGTLETDVNNHLIGADLVTLDLKCFKSSNAACAVTTDTYTLLSILNILVVELCAAKARILALENA